MQRKYYATGRRKTSAARVFLTVGSGQFTVNNRPLHQYFQPIQRQDCLEPFLVSKTAGIFDVYCTVKGGGMSGQAGAVRLGISRALQIFEPELRGHLKKGTHPLPLRCSPCLLVCVQWASWSGTRAAWRGRSPA